MAFRGILALAAAAALIAGAQDDAQINAWVNDLAHPDHARSMEAQKNLVKAGVKALPALKAAFESKTPELAARARIVAGEIERLEAERLYDQKQRPRRLEIVTLQVKDAPLSEVLKTLGAQVDSTLHTTIDPKKKLTIDVKDVPMRKCLDQMEDLLQATIVSRPTWHRVSAGAPPKRKKRAYVPGATFEFGLAPFAPDGQPAGWSLVTDQTGTARIFVDSIEAFDAQKNPVEVERCGRCSPRYVHLKTDKPAPFTIKFKGRLVWESPYETAMADPGKTQDYHVGPFLLKYQFPRVTWVSNESFPPHLIGRAELSGKLKKQGTGPAISGAMGVGAPPPMPRPEKSWCECEAGPMPLQPAPPGKISGGSHFESAFQARKPEEFETMKVRFYKPIEEAFETEVTVTEDGK